MSVRAIRSAICTASMDLPTLESAKRQDNSPSYQKLFHSARGAGCCDASRIVRLAVLMVIMPTLSGMPVCTWEALCKVALYQTDIILVLFHNAYQLRWVGLRRCEEEMDSFSSSSDNGTGFFREDSSHLSSSSR